MAKNWTLWRKDENDDDERAEQHETGRKYQSLWDVPDDDVAFEDEDVFGGSGYQGPIFEGDESLDGYNYKTTIDDSDPQWYRRSSFRYSRHVDYSPSQLFRSKFSTRYYSSGNNEAQNKAIRALRVLTRNANTITDKSAKGTYAIQYSAGADNNGASDQLNNDKQRVVYVSPDKLLATTTTEQEDNVVDALTGFVLLRVQLAQTTNAEIIGRLNATSNRGMGLHLSQQLFAKKTELEHIPDEELAAMAGSTADLYLAGILAKSMLMRLARRGVVQNWGGFAPYFIRHAKKFSAMREKLTAEELSLESLVGRLAYNMLDDETPIEPPAFAVEVMNKHLSVEVEPEQLLQTCKEIVAELRAHMVTAEMPTSAAGGVESALNDMLQDMKKARAASSSSKSELENYLENMANAMFDAAVQRNETQLALGALKNSENENRARLSENKSLEQLSKRLEKTLNQLKKQLENTSIPAHERVAELGKAAGEAEYDIAARPKARRALERDGRQDELDNLAAAIRDITKDVWTRTDAGPKDIEALLEKLQNFKAAAKETLDKASESVETALQEKLTRAEKLVQALKEQHAKLHERLRSAYEKARETDDTMPETLTSATNDALAYGMTNITEAQEVLNSLASKIQDLAARLPKTRSAGGVEKVDNELNGALEQVRTDSRLSSILNDCHVWHGSDTLRQMASELHHVDAATDRETVVPPVVRNALRHKQLTSNEMTAVAANELFKQDTKHPKGLRDYESEEIEQLKKQHAEHSETIDQLRRLLNSATACESSSSENAAETGAHLQKRLDARQAAAMPVDEELFGKTIKATTKILDGDAIGRANDEARNDPEEDYIAYIHGSSSDAARPKVVTEKETAGGRRSTGAASVIKQVCQQYRNFIERIKDALQFQAGKRTEEQFGMLSGDLDEGGLHKLNYDCEHIWSRKTTSRLPDVAVGILVDQSGSMSGMKIEQARTMCIILAEALRKIGGVRLYVYGHTANTRSGADLTIFEHYTPAMGPNLTQLGSIRAHTNNYDGYAIKDVAKRLAADPAKKKYLFVIADGLPAGSGYGGSDAQKHVASVCKFIRNRLKMGLYAFAVGVPSYERKMFKNQYDENHIVFVDNVMKCLPQIVRFLRNALQKEKKLVHEAD